jgi:hypothetical protein
VVDEPDSVGEVPEPIDEVIVGLGRVARLRRLRLAAPPAVLGARRTVGRGRHEQALPIGRPGERVDATREIGQAARLAAVERQEVDLLAVLALLRVAGGGLLLDVHPPVREERERPPVRREPRVPIVPSADRQAARRAVAVGLHRPQGMPVAVLDGSDRLDGEHGE